MIDIDIRQRLAEAGEVRRLDLRARATAAFASGDDLAVETIIRESLTLGEDGITEINALVANRERVAATEVEGARKRNLLARIWEASARRLAATERAETALGELVDALAASEAARQSLAQLASAMPVPMPSALEPSEAALSASRFIAAALARLGTESRFGGIRFPMGLTSGANGSWSAADRRVIERFASSIEAERTAE